MARKVSERQDESAAESRADESREEVAVEPIRAADREAFVAVPVSGDALAQAQAQAEISGAGSDTIPQHVVEAANRGRLARGEDVVVMGNVSPVRDLFAPKDSPFGEMDGVGEDTQAVKQSQVPRLRDGKRVSAEQVHQENQDQ